MAIPSSRTKAAETLPDVEPSPPQLLLCITQELTQMISQPHELNGVLSYVLEGLFRVLPADFVAMFLFDRHGECWREKLCLGRRPDSLDINMTIRLDKSKSNDATPYCWKRKKSTAMDLPVNDFFWGSVGGSSRSVCAWLVVANDKQLALSESDYLSFKQLCDLASIAFRLAKQDRRGA
jgi:hypothetical protein